jgi:hypothetical protein
MVRPLPFRHLPGILSHGTPAITLIRRDRRDTPRVRTGSGRGDICALQISLAAHPNATLLYFAGVAVVMRGSFKMTNDSTQDFYRNVVGPLPPVHHLLPGEADLLPTLLRRCE